MSPFSLLHTTNATMPAVCMHVKNWSWQHYSISVSTVACGFCCHHATLTWNAYQSSHRRGDVPACLPPLFELVGVSVGDAGCSQTETGTRLGIQQRRGVGVRTVYHCGWVLMGIHSPVSRKLAKLGNRTIS